MRLTVFFDGRFWTGIFEWERGGAARACRHVFGPEPGDQEILELVKAWSPPDVPDAVPAEQLSVVNPKRLAREASRLLAARGASTRSQEALRRAREAGKAASRGETRAARDARAAAKRTAARAKARKKHRGH